MESLRVAETPLNAQGGCTPHEAPSDRGQPANHAALHQNRGRPANRKARNRNRGWPASPSPLPTSAPSRKPAPRKRSENHQISWRIARSEVEGELESFGLVYASHAAGSHLAVASPAEVLPLTRRLPRVVDRTAARRHKAERAGLEAHRDGRTRYSAGNEKRQGICSGDEPGLFLA